ncbi:MAG: PIG-L family deacetylase [Chloroflexota bacterium]|nr:PIG-L family deacetylase [Chloroflexota bacterium]
MERSLLFSFAHPDDESFSVAGVSCMYSEQGVHIALATATLGEEATLGDPPVATRDELPRIRERELHVAAEILGVEHVHLLGYRDKALSTAPPDEIRGKLVGVIRRHRPQVVITFDPNGANGHPDHLAISRFTSDAVAAAADPRWHPEAGAAHRVARLLWTSPVMPWDVMRMPDTAERPGVDFLIDIRRWWERKAAALQAHRTQYRPINRLFFADPDTERVLGGEAFRQAWGPPLPRRPMDDLFADIRDGQ